MKQKASEQEVAARVVAYLEDCGFDVYQEVSFGWGSETADIVAVNGPEIWIVEVKTGWSLELLQQLRTHKRWGRAHRLLAAVPTSRHDPEHRALFKDCGFGVISVKKNEVTLAVKAPRLTSHLLPTTMALLDEGHKTHAQAGAPCARGRWTPFRRTCEALLAVVGQNPGITLKDAIAKVDHHYSSEAGARASIAMWIRKGVISGIRAEQQGSHLLLFLDQN